MFQKFIKFIKYLLGKSSELADLEKKDALLAQTVLRIHRKRTHSKIVLVPLFSLKQIHAIDRENAMTATENRVKELLKVKDILLKKKNLSVEILAEYLPSVSGIKVVKQSEQSYIAYEGNGRLVALQKVFSKDDDIHVEVEEYYFKNPQKIINKMTQVRKLNGLEK